MRRRKSEAVPEVDTTPLRALASTGASHTLVRPRDSLLILKPIRVVPVVGCILGLVLLLVGLGIALRSGHPAAWFVGGIGLVITAAFSALVLFTRGFTFDREGGTYLVRRFGSSRRNPLDQIRVVQLIPGGWHGSGDRPKFYTYQLNLVLNDPEEPRLNLTNTSNWEETWRIASELADFLEVPLLDRVSR